MGEESSSNSTSEYVDADGCDVVTNYDTQIMLNVYDLTPMNQYAIWFGFGIFHSGIEGEKYPDFRF